MVGGHPSSSAAFRFEVGVVLCKNCGAPFEVPPTNGWVQCTYCRAQHQVTERRSNVDPRNAAVDEQARLNHLFQQDGGGYPFPNELRRFLRNGFLNPKKEREAIATWHHLVQTVQQSQNQQASDQLRSLTEVLANHYGLQGAALYQRSMFETALGALADPRHRQFMLGMLAQQAAKGGEVEAAEQWLELCDPRSSDLDMDSSYRLARAIVETARGDWFKVLDTLGTVHGAVPVYDMWDLLASALRIHALEMTGRTAQAQQEAMRCNSGQIPNVPATGLMTVVTGYRKNYGWVLCPQSVGSPR